MAGVKEITLVAPTNLDLVQTLIYGPSGLMAAYHESDPDFPQYIVSQAIVKFPKSNAKIRLISGETPERARGLNSELLLVDELGSIPNAEELISNLLFGLRLGKAQALFITSPRATPTIIDLYNRRDADVKLMTGSSYDNRENLSDNFFKNAESYKGTKRYRQEILGELILENDMAHWNSDMIDASKIKPDDIPWDRMKKIALGLDPAGAGAANSRSKQSDQFGIVAVGIDADDVMYVLEDRTAQQSTAQWVNNCRQMYAKYSEVCPTIFVVEGNGVGSYVAEVLERDLGRVPIKTIKSTVSKLSRAEPVALLYIQGKVKHPNNVELTELENEMVSYDGTGRSPNHLDAMVFAVLELNPVKKNSSKVFRFSF